MTGNQLLDALLEMTDEERELEVRADGSIEGYAVKRVAVDNYSGLPIIWID